MIWPILFLVLLVAFAALLSTQFYRYRQLQNQFLKVEDQLSSEKWRASQSALELAEIKKTVAQYDLKDFLTGLPTRRLFEEKLLQLMQESKRHALTFAVMFVDLDDFKMINNALGHEVGDQILKETAQRLQTTVRNVDLLGHFAGDEFVCVLPKLAKAESAVYVAQRILNSIAQPFIVNDQEIFITASIGISTYPYDGSDISSLLINAETALHQAKSYGINSYQFFQADMHAKSMREFSLHKSLRGASLYKDFQLYYQPQVNLETKTLMAIDVLLHWQHPEFGLIPLSEFMRIAENCGKLAEISDWMLTTALMQFKQWNEEKIYFNRMAIAVCSRQLENPHFSYHVARLLKEMNVDPSCLILKVAEDVLLEKLDMIKRSLGMLHELGVKIAIDEFGAGQVAFLKLKKFHMDFLKIHPDLIKDVTTNPESEAIVKMIVALAQSLNVIAITNGVETKEQEKLLNELGCHIMQGSLIAPPALANDVKKETFMAS